MNIEADYRQALEYLDSLTDYSLMRNLQFSEDKFNLTRMIALMNRIGDPQDTYPIIHVAGTKGKGSTCAFIAGGLQAAGYKVGLYTSPHLLEYTERIQINRQPILEQELAELVMQLKPVAEEVGQITKFELTTAAAFLFFARNGVNAAVIEVGLGGRLDATNIVHPLVSVITSLSYDHMNVLGNTLTAIAGEKAGIIKTNRPVVISPQKAEALEAVLAVAQARQAPITLVGKDVLFEGGEHSLNGQDLCVWNDDDQKNIENKSSDWTPVNLHIELLGRHQVQNAATAYTALQTAAKFGLPINLADIQAGFKNTQWPGRFEIVRNHPFVVFDSAHNRDSAQRLRITVEDYFKNRPVVMLFGVSEDKDVTGMFEELMPCVNRVVAAQAVSSRAMDAGKLIDLAHSYGKPASTEKDVKSCLVKALEYCGQDAVLLITGSMFLVAEARRAWDDLIKEGRE